MKIKPITLKNNIVVQELEKELLAYDLQTNKAFCLNETSAIVFQLCDGKRNITEISDLMSQKLKNLVGEDFIILALNELRRDGLLENDAVFIEYFSKFSRRELVKQVGTASMIALPFITSVTAPRAVDAQSSCLTNGVSCTFSNFTQSDCCSNLRCGFTRASPRCDPSALIAGRVEGALLVVY